MSDTEQKPFLSRWAQRKAGKQTEVDVLEEVAQTEQVDATGETEEEAALSDEELCARYELPDPEHCTDSEQLDGFFDGQIPDRLRQLAMRRLWRLNPLFRFADEMVEYGEDFTDAATVIPNMQTAYKVGKGYLDKILAEKEEADNKADLVVAEMTEAEKAESKAVASADDNVDEQIGEPAEADKPTSTEEVDDNVLATGNEDKYGTKTAGNQNDLNIENIKENNDETTFRPKRMVFSKTRSSAGQENS